MSKLNFQHHYSVFSSVSHDPSEIILKGLVHPKMKMMSLMTHPHVVPSP